MFGRDVNPVGSPFRLTNMTNHEEVIDPQNVDRYRHIISEYMTTKMENPDSDFNYGMFTRWSQYGHFFAPFAGVFGYASAKLFRKTGFFKYVSTLLNKICLLYVCFGKVRN